MNFEQFMEEWKPFPKDKVNRQIEKKPEGSPNKKTMTAVKNFKTKATDTNKQKQFMTGKDQNKINDAFHKSVDDRDKSLEKSEKSKNKQAKAENKGKNKKADKHEKKADKHHADALRHQGRYRTMDAVARSYRRTSPDEDKKQAEHNKKDKESRATAKRMMDRAGLESAYKKSNDKPTSKTESMNFSEWQESLCPSLYEIDENPKCPPGYKWSKKQMMCVPKTAKDDVSKNDKRDSHPGNGPGYHTIGSHGQNGAPYAYEEPASSDSVSESHDYDKEDEDEKKFKKDDDKMKYGKEGKPSSLRPGEVRKYNKETGKWESNK